jgi:NADH dehydrogenase (ubiquinone) Fe-S protein 6
MLSSARTRLAALAARATLPSLLRPLSISPFLSNQGPGTGENSNQANDPSPRKETPNVSATNETAVDAYGAQDKALQEAQLDAERQRQLQAPNRPGIWSRNQQERSIAMSGPRFEQTIMDTQVWQGGWMTNVFLTCIQPQPYAAIDLIHKQPVRWVSAKSVACDGGGGPLGHPKIFINTDKPQVCVCTYCGLPYVCVPCFPSQTRPCADFFEGKYTSQEVFGVTTINTISSQVNWQSS